MVIYKLPYETRQTPTGGPRERRETGVKVVTGEGEEKEERSGVCVAEFGFPAISLRRVITCTLSALYPPASSNISSELLKKLCTLEDAFENTDQRFRCCPIAVCNQRDEWRTLGIRPTARQ
jgi:hypothetical protein